MGEPWSVPHFLADAFTPEQWRAMLAPLEGRRVSQDPGGNDYLQQNDVRRWLTRVFGFGGWSEELLELTCVREYGFQVSAGSEKEAPRSRWWVTYRAQVRLYVRTRQGRRLGPWDDVSVHEASNQPKHGDAHGQAAKSAVSEALKRCAVNLGDQFGLSLYFGSEVFDYRAGRSLPVVGWTAVRAPDDQPTAPRPADPPVPPAAADPTVEPDPPAPEEQPPAEQPQAAGVTIHPRPDGSTEFRVPTGQATPTVLDRVTPEQRQQATGQQTAPTPQPRQARNRQERDGAETYLSAAEAAAKRGDRAGVEAVWRQAKTDGLLDVVVAGAADAPVMLVDVITEFGRQATARRGSAYADQPAEQRRPGEPAPGFSEWTGAGQR